RYPTVLDRCWFPVLNAFATLRTFWTEERIGPSHGRRPSAPRVENCKGGQIGRNEEIPHLGAGRHRSGWPPQLPDRAVAAHEGLHGSRLRARFQDHDAL